MQNTIKIANALGMSGRPEHKLTTVRDLFEAGKVPTEFKKGAAVELNGKTLVDEKGNPITGSAVRAAAEELGYDLVVTAKWEAKA